MRILLVVVLVMGVAYAETPTQVATKLVNAHLDALKNNDDTEGKALEKTFAPDGLVIAPDGDLGTPKTGLPRVKTSIVGGNVGGMPAGVASVKIGSLTSGGDDKVTWLAAELEFVTYSRNAPKTAPRSTHTIRLTELAVADGGKWKVVAALFGKPGTPKRDSNPPLMISGETKPGSLSKILVSPEYLSNGLAKDATVVVFGTDKAEKAIGGPAAKKLVDSWKSLKLEIEGDVREIATSTYGFVQANVNWVKPGGAPYRMRALMIATRDGTSDPWTIRAVQFAIP